MKTRIVYFEDNMFYRTLVSRALRCQGFEVIEFAGIQNSLDPITMKADLIILDIGLKEGNSGLDIIRNFQLPTIVLSGQDRVKTAVRCMRKGVYEYLVKEETTIPELILTTKSLAKRIHELKKQNRLKGRILNNKILIGKTALFLLFLIVLGFCF